MFSNLYPCKINIEGVVYQSTEHYFQMAKYDQGNKNFMMLLNTGQVAQFGQRRLKLSKEHIMLIEKLKQEKKQIPINSQNNQEYKVGDNANPKLIVQNWDIVKLNVMFKGLQAKFGQNNQLKEMLLSTQNAWLIEHTKNDKQWADGDNGVGTNFLGKLLMYLREELRGKSVKQNFTFLKTPMNKLIQY